MHHIHLVQLVLIHLSELSSLVSARQKLESQQSENESVQKAGQQDPIRYTNFTDISKGIQEHR